MQRHKDQTLSHVFIAGCPRVAGDDEDNVDRDDFEDEFQTKNNQLETPNQHHVQVINPSVIQSKYSYSY